jgi:hypothetical protein
VCACMCVVRGVGESEALTGGGGEEGRDCQDQ